MSSKLSVKTVIPPVLFSIACYLSWTFGRAYFCGVPF